jgi:hypothetical protein
MRSSSRWQAALRAHPEWWIEASGIGCWGLMVYHGATRWDHALHQQASLGAELMTWHAMVVAMALPTLARHARAVALRSFVERRHYAIAAFVVSYLAPWSILGAIAIPLRQAWWRDAPWTLPAICAVATAWAVLPVRERAMTMVHAYAPVLAPDGWRAVRDWLTTGFTVATTCIVSCWPMMLACAFSGHDLAVVGAAGVIGLAESRSFRPPRRLVIAVSAALTLFVAIR